MPALPRSSVVYYQRSVYNFHCYLTRESTRHLIARGVQYSPAPLRQYCGSVKFKEWKHSPDWLRICEKVIQREESQSWIDCISLVMLVCTVFSSLYRNCCMRYIMRQDLRNTGNAIFVQYFNFDNVVIEWQQIMWKYLVTFERYFVSLKNYLILHAVVSKLYLFLICTYFTLSVLEYSFIFISHLLFLHWQNISQRAFIQRWSDYLHVLHGYKVAFLRLRWGSGTRAVQPHFSLPIHPSRWTADHDVAFLIDTWLSLSSDRLNARVIRSSCQAIPAVFIINIFFSF